MHVKSQEGNTIVIVLSAINTVATVGIITVLATSFIREKNKPSIDDVAASAIAEAEGDRDASKEGESKGGDKKSHNDFGKMVPLDQFTINLATPGSLSPKYVKVNISLEVQNTDIESEVTSKMPQVRNVIIDLFNSKKVQDLATGDGREFLKEEIKNALNGFLVNGKIKSVYFTNFALTG